MSILCISDNDQDKLLIVDLDSMSVRHTISVGKSPYPVDRVTEDVVFVSTRREQSILPVNVMNGTTESEIPLPHRPRSTTRHPTRSIGLVGGVETSLTTVIDTALLKPLFSVGKGDTDNRRDFGGTLACGHPAWATETSFIHLDRIERRLELFDLETREQLSWCNLPTSPHHVEKSDDTLFVMCEGNRESLIPPSVAKISIAKKSLVVENHTFLPIPLMAFSSTGGHHLTVDTSHNRIYVGTADARLYTLDAATLQVLNIIDAGAGCGHVTLCPELELGITTNHTDTFMTVFEIKSGRKYAEIPVSTQQNGSKKTQGHTSKWFASKGLFYTTAAQDGKILEIKPETLEITRELSVDGAYLIQGTFV